MWLVNDQFGLAFVKRFHEYLTKLPRREALRQTQLDCAEGELRQVGGIDTARPIFWAGYQLYGDGGSLKL